jgi:hypothetical protein
MDYHEISVRREIAGDAPKIISIALRGLTHQPMSQWISSY